MSSYEDRRAQNVADNLRVLKELGIFQSLSNKKVVQNKRRAVKRKVEKLVEKSPVIVKSDEISAVPLPDDSGDYSSKRRRSSRIRNVPVNAVSLPDDEDEERKTPKPKGAPRPNSYGPIEGVEVGRTWNFRMECSHDGIHRPPVSGIHGGPDGAYSLAMSGGYEDDIDLGVSFTFTGEGGRDLKGTSSNPKNLRTAPQSKNQSLVRGNLALSRNIETGNPVRVIRGFKLNSPFAPEDCYRYDGLYEVQKTWYTPGLSGYMVYKFALKRIEDQAPPPWEIEERNIAAAKPDTTDANNNEDEKENLEA